MWRTHSPLHGTRNRKSRSASTKRHRLLMNRVVAWGGACPCSSSSLPCSPSEQNLELLIHCRSRTRGKSMTKQRCKTFYEKSQKRFHTRLFQLFSENAMRKFEKFLWITWHISLLKRQKRIFGKTA